MNDARISRRELLTSVAALPVLGLSTARPVVAGRPGGASRPRNIIFMVSDGMSAGVPALTESFARMKRGQGTHWHALANDPATVRGYLETESLSSMVTDSAAAASAWGSGSRVANGAVNVLPDGTRLRPIADVAREAGRAVGLVTTTTITHATPAGFAAVQPSRADQAAIAPQYLGLVDVALGGGDAYFEAASRPDGCDLLGVYRDAGYTVCTSSDDLAGARGSRLLGVFDAGHLPYAIDRAHRPDAHRRVPSLPVMTRAALECLAGRDQGFLLQVEGGRVDHAAHSNDAAGLLWDQLEFDDAVAVALAFLAEEPDTLVVVTTDHGNANPGLNGIGPGYGDSTACFERLASIEASFTTMGAALGADGGMERPRATDDVIDIVREHTRITLTADEAAAVARARAGQPIAELNHQHTGLVGALGQAIGNHTGIAWTGTSHTSELALTLATGAGKERFAGVMHHTDVFGVLTDFMGVAHVNPRMG